MARPVKELAEAFRNLAAFIGNGGTVEVAAFAHACSLITPLFSLFTTLGPIIRQAEVDYVSKVRDIMQASRTIATLPQLVDEDIRRNTSETLGSHTRNLLRLNRALEMLKVIFREMLATRNDSMIGPVSTAYSEAFGAYHVLDAQNIFTYALPAIPSRSHLTRMVNETDHSARSQMQTYVTASTQVIDYVNRIYNFRGLGIDW